MKIRYQYINFIIKQIYVNLNINSYPINILDIFSNYKNCKVVSYSHHMKRSNITYSQMISFANSKDASTVYNNKRYLIFYNDLIRPYERQYWTLAHELGHIMLGHLENYNNTRIFRSSLSDSEYTWMEKEADYFASQLLANNLILKELKIENSMQIAKLSNLSKQASKNKFDSFKKYLKFNFKTTDLDKLVLNQFDAFINTTICTNCGYRINTKKCFCPICNESNFERVVTEMIYDQCYELNEKSRAIICPKCENENLEHAGSYCQICGTYLINKCAGQHYIKNTDPDDYENNSCNALASSNARYCVVCGSKTTFFENELLEDYNIEKQKKEILDPDSFIF